MFAVPRPDAGRAGNVGGDVMSAVTGMELASRAPKWWTDCLESAFKASETAGRSMFSLLGSTASRSKD